MSNSMSKRSLLIFVALIIFELTITCKAYSIKNYDLDADTVYDSSTGRVRRRDDPPRWNPSIGMSWQWLIGINTNIPKIAKTAIYDADVDNGFIPNTTVKYGARSICYVGSLEIGGGRPDEQAIVTYNKTVTRILGPAYPGWPGEYFLNYKNAQVRTFMAARFQRMKDFACDAIEPDNLDIYVQNGAGFNLTPADAYDYIQYLTKIAHGLGMSIALKNADDVVKNYPTIVNDVDFAIVEACYKYGSCATFAPFIVAQKPVFEMDYSSGSCGSIGTSTAKLSTDCTYVNSYNFEGLISNCNLNSLTAKVCQTANYNSAGIRSNAGTPPLVWKPQIGTGWQYLVGKNVTANISKTFIYNSDVDLGYTPALIHSWGGKAICYVNVGMFELSRPDAASFISLNNTVAAINTVGVISPSNYLDIRDPGIQALISARIDRMASLGCDAIDANVDHLGKDGTDYYTITTGFPLSASDAKSYLDFLATKTHSLQLAIGLHNNVGLVAAYPDLVTSHDFVVSESCYKYSNCRGFYPFILAGK
ncbi:hypothetical protein HDU76_004223, partial [Blyttiomyces sp. JEL0837]